MDKKTFAITAAKATVEIQSVSSSAGSSISQQISLNYVMEGSSLLSGNPGYKKGSAVWLSTDNSLVQGLSISDTSGYCYTKGGSQTLVLTPITYGTDMVVTCIVPTSNNFQSFCESADVLTSLAGILRVGKLGNANIALSSVFSLVFTSLGLGPNRHHI